MKKATILITLVIFILLVSSTSFASPLAQEEGEAYTVQADDWLSKLADKTYGNMFAWPAIWKATNTKAAEDDSFARIDDPNVVEVGQKLWIPGFAAAEALLVEEGITFDDQPAMAASEPAMATDETAMADDETAMATDETAMADDETAMADDETAMATDETAMAGDETAMADDETAMADDETAMADDETAMADDETAMDDDETAMADDETAMADDETAMADDETAAAADETAMADDETAMADDETAMADDEHAAAAHWSYEGADGPEFWGGLSDDYKACAEGLSQSPIDIVDATAQDSAAIVFNYQPSALTIVNNGHTIQVDYDAGSSIEVDGVQYNLAQFHFHTLSEHTLAGQNSPMELHLVHQSEAGALAVVGVMLNDGAENVALEAVWANLPTEVDAKQTLELTVDANDLLPAERQAYRYSGSLTTPPCTEGVSWLVMTTPVEVSTAQVDAFKTIIPFNNRPVQPLNERELLMDMAAGS